MVHINSRYKQKLIEFQQQDAITRLMILKPQDPMDYSLCNKFDCKPSKEATRKKTFLIYKTVVNI